MRRYSIKLLLALAAVNSILLFSPKSQAGEADVVKVEVKQSSGGFSFSVTLKHGDEGWDHYANRWEVVSPDGIVLGTRTLAHPHVNEQPFTRSLSNVQIPDTIKQVEIRAGDSQHDLGGITMTVDLPGR